MNKEAGIWCRVSTIGQAGLSPDSQVEHCRQKLKSEGYEVKPEHILIATWSSTELANCPEYLQLWDYIARKDISAVACLDRDRLSCKGAERLAFLAHCKENGVKFLVCQGVNVELSDEAEQELLEVALTLAKRKQVERAGKGSRDGLFDKMQLKQKPSFMHRIRGYNWDGELRLVPNDDYWQVALALRLFLGGSPTREVQRELERRGVKVAIPTICGWLINPVYAGRFAGHRKIAKKPKNPTGKSARVNSSIVRLPIEQWIFVDRVEVVNAPITWSDFLEIQERLKRNQLQAQRNANHDYLLRSRVVCEKHTRRYHGRPHHSSWLYVCPVRGCSKHYINGPKLEKYVKDICREIITKPSIVNGELQRFKSADLVSEDDIQLEIVKLNNKRNSITTSEAEAEVRHIAGVMDDVVYAKVKATYRATKVGISEGLERCANQLTVLRQKKQLKANYERVRQRLGEILGNADDVRWHEIIDMLGVHITVSEDGQITVNLSVPRNVEIENKSAIVLTAPGLG